MSLAIPTLSAADTRRAVAGKLHELQVACGTMSLALTTGSLDERMVADFAAMATTAAEAVGRVHHRDRQQQVAASR